ncbi:MAG: hypothetical protein GXY83_35945 [Rhodopirellula sp.]|nr:hypothetical protein [Rhodopirellula sp.]
MADVLKKVQRGQPLTIPANTYNAFVDAALDYQKRKLSQQSAGMRSERQHGIVLVRNDSGADRDRFDVLGVSGPVFDPATDPEAFKNYPAMTGVTPTEADHRGKFVVLLEPVPAGKLARAVAAGVVPARVDVPDEDYPYRLADITDGSAANLTAAKIGSAAILWREGGIGVQWALVRLANLPEPTLFPVNLTQTGGSQGTTTTPASWTYSVIDPVTGETLATNVNPTVSPHKWKRPSAGWMITATFGYAHWNTDGDLALGWINEMVEQEACSS